LFHRGGTLERGSAASDRRNEGVGRVDLIALGLALFDFVFFWNAFKAS
jgi:hypothetical protein